MPNYWKCSQENCEDDTTYTYKGLCRSCSIYDDVGECLEPKPRLRVNRDGSEYHQALVSRGHVVTRQEKMNVDKQYAKDRKMATKMRKVRQIMREEGIDMSHVCDDSCNHSEELNDVIQIGESVHVHDENCNHEEE